MAKQFVRAGEADKRAIDLYFQIRAVEQMPLIEIQFSDDHKKISVGDRNRRPHWRTLSVDSFLSLDVPQAVAKGGTWENLLDSWKRPKPRLPQREVDEAVQDFLLGEESK